jgi:hypothetical protein
VAESAFTQAFLRRFVEVEKVAPTSELAILDLTLARIVNDPNLPERFPAFYDPRQLTYLVRASRFLVEFAFDEASDTVTFVSLFYRG